MGAIRENITQMVGECVLYNKSATDISAAIDTAAYPDGLSFFLIYDALATGSTITLTFEHCDTSGGTFTAVDTSNLVYGRYGDDVNVSNTSGATKNAEGNACAREALVGAKRYVKVAATLSGSTGNYSVLLAKSTTELPAGTSGSVSFVP